MATATECGRACDDARFISPKECAFRNKRIIKNTVWNRKNKRIRLENPRFLGKSRIFGVLRELQRLEREKSWREGAVDGGDGSVRYSATVLQFDFTVIPRVESEFYLYIYIYKYI